MSHPEGGTERPIPHQCEMVFIIVHKSLATSVEGLSVTAVTAILHM